MARPGRNLGVRASFADAAQTIADFFGVPAIENGNSFL
jgi:phosphopentomutase